jgi:hypothetical protein
MTAQKKCQSTFLPDNVPTSTKQQASHHVRVVPEHVPLLAVERALLRVGDAGVAEGHVVWRTAE